MQVWYAHVCYHKNHNHHGQWYEPVTDQRAYFKGANVQIGDGVLCAFGQNHLCECENQDPKGFPEQVRLKTNLIQVNTLDSGFLLRLLKT
jgi:hypothetical protein